MSIDDLIPGGERDDERPAVLLTGTVLDDAGDANDLIRVRLDVDRDQFVGPMTFMPRGATLPTVGDRALVGFDSFSGEPWIVAWKED